MKKLFSLLSLLPVALFSDHCAFFGAETGVFGLYYEEVTGGKVLDKVEGFFPQWNLYGTYISGPLFLKGELIYAFGSGQYKGSTLDGSPLSTSTKQEFFFSSISGGWTFFTCPRFISITPLVTIGRRVWIRDVPPALFVEGFRLNSYTETYTHNYAMLGARFDSLFCSCWSFNTTLSVGYIFAPSLRTSLPFAEGATLFLDAPLGSRPIIEWDLQVGYRLPVGSLVFGTQAQYFTYGRSKIDRSGVFEPNSSTYQAVFNLGWQSCF